MILVLAACTSQALLAVDYTTLTREVTDAHARVNCAPRDLALLDAHYDFVKVEFSQGNTRRASEHVGIAREHLAAVAACATIDKVATEARPIPSSTDKDNDGVVDLDDGCPDDAEDLDGFRDVDGCPDLDNDGDGVADEADPCRDEAEDRDGWLDVDGCPDLDNDGDGVPDTADQCRDEMGAVAEQGCPSQDLDQDGIGDATDRCPSEPETKNGYSDVDGCPDTPPTRVEITAQQIVIKERINFATGKVTILPDSFAVLDDVAQVMRDYPKVVVEIGGHTDNVGDETVNQRLSKGRADAVFEFLLSKGIPANRMRTVGYGETMPIDTNISDGGRLNNRRVEFKIVGQ